MYNVALVAMLEEPHAAGKTQLFVNSVGDQYVHAAPIMRLRVFVGPEESQKVQIRDETVC